MHNLYNKYAAGLFYSLDEAEAAVGTLKDNGYDLDNLSIIAKNVDEISGTEITEDIGNKADNNAATGALASGALGSITGLLVEV